MSSPPWSPPPPSAGGGPSSYPAHPPSAPASSPAFAAGSFIPGARPTWYATPPKESKAKVIAIVGVLFGGFVLLIVGSIAAGVFWFFNATEEPIRVATETLNSLQRGDEVAASANLSKEDGATGRLEMSAMADFAKVAMTGDETVVNRDLQSSSRTGTRAVIVLRTPLRNGENAYARVLLHQVGEAWTVTQFTLSRTEPEVGSFVE